MRTKCAGAQAEEQHHGRADLGPAAGGVVQHIERGGVGPLKIIDEEQQRRLPGQRLAQARDGLEQPGTRGCLLARLGRASQPGQVRVLVAQLGQQPAQLRQPGVAQPKQRMRSACICAALQAGAQGIDQRLVGQPPAGLEHPSVQHIGALGCGPGQKLRRQPRLADPGFALERHNLGHAPAGGMVGRDQCAELVRAPDQRRPGDHQAGRSRCLVRRRWVLIPWRALRRSAADALGQGDRLRRWLDPQFGGQDSLAGLVGAQRRRPVASAEMQLHQVAMRLLVEWIEGQPAQHGIDRALDLAGFGVQLHEPLAHCLRPMAPDLALNAGPLVEGRGVAECEAFEKIAAIALDRRLEPIQQAAPRFILQAYSRRVRQSPGRLQRLQIEIEIGSGIEAQRLARDDQMGSCGRGLRVAGVAQRTAQKRKRFSQRRPSVFGIALRPEERAEFLAGVHTALHRQIGEQRQRLARREGHGGTGVADLGRTQPGQL